MPKLPMRDVVVLLPGITGSVLQKDGRDVWAMTPGAVARALFSLGNSIEALELHEDDQDDGVTAPRIMPDLHLIPGLWKIDGYSKVAAFIRERFDVVADENFFHFPYDWRRDNRIAARRLAEESHTWLKAWRDRSGNDDAKLVLIGHSMGGLVARYFIECLEGWRDTRALVTFGTPFRGSLNGLSFIVQGLKKSLGPITLIDLSRLLRSFTSVYQLLPIYKCYDPGDGRMMRVSEAEGIPNLDPSRAKSADEFHREIERAVAAHRDDDAYLRDRYTLRQIVGTFQPTLQSARWNGETVELLYEGQDQDGDGTVPRVSASPTDLSGEEGAMFAAERHASLQNNDGVLVQLSGVLTGRDTSDVRAGADVGLDIDDAFGAEEPVAFRVRSEDPTAELRAAVMDAQTDEVVAEVGLGSGAEWRAGEIAPLPPGTYRVTVDATAGVEPVTDAFVVLGTEPPGAEEPRRRAVSGIQAYPPIPETAAPAAEDTENAGVPAIGDAEPAEPAVESRFLQGRFPERVALGDRVSLLVRLGMRTEAAGPAVELKPIAVPSEGVHVLLVLHSPGFTPRSASQAQVRVFPGKDSDWALFELEAIERGVQTLEVTAFLGGTFLGALSIQASVEADVPTGMSVDRAAAVGGRQRDPGEIALLIHYDAEDAVYRYQLIDWSGAVPEEARSNRLLRTPQVAVETLVKQLNAVARGAMPWDAKTTREWLKGQGIELWNSFIPDALQREFWARRDRISRMTIVCAGDPVPWELLYPFSPGDGDAGFLVDQFPVARWLYGSAPVGSLALSTADFVLPEGSPPSAKAEIDGVAALLAGRTNARQPVTDLTSLLELFAKADFSVLHFACHNTFQPDTPDASRVLFGSQPLQPVFLKQHAERFRETSPLVFMNACRTDGQAPVYTRLDGWALSFLAAGAGAFIGSLWEVVDHSAGAYAKEFYRAALGGATLGDAAKQAREAIREEPGDPTWLAYTLYGDPGATIA